MGTLREDWIRRPSRAERGFPVRVIQVMLSIALIAATMPNGVLAQYDELGNNLPPSTRVIPGAASAPGDACGTCKDPDPSVWGVEFRNGEMWLVSVRKTLYRLNNCVLVSATPLAGVVLPAGLGYDVRRDLFFVTDASLNAVFQVTPSGRVLGRWPTQGTGPVGAAYDSRRDLYWISDWEEDRLYAIDPNTGLPGPSLAIPGGSRISGTAYDSELDALIYHSRDEALTYWVSAQTGAILAVYAIPPGQNNGLGAAITPEGNLWLTHWEAPTSFCRRGLSAEGPERDRRRDLQYPIFTDPPDTGPALQGAYPNPFNPVTRIRYTLPTATFVTLSIFDVSGRLVETLVEDTRPAGDHTVEWRAAGAASGVYFCRLTWQASSATHRLILLK
jgi:hypothetical protein